MGAMLRLWDAEMRIGFRNRPHTHTHTHTHKHRNKQTNIQMREGMNGLLTTQSVQ